MPESMIEPQGSVPPKNKTVLVSIVTGVVTALVVGGGVYAYKHSQNTKTKNDLQAQIDALRNQATASPTVAPTETATATPTTGPTAATTAPTADPVASWKTYTNSRYGYSIKYPSSWYIISTDSEKDFTARGTAPQDYIGGDTWWSNYPKVDYSLPDKPVDFNVIPLLIYKTDLDTTFRDFYNTKYGQVSGNTITNYKDTTIAGKAAKTFDLRNEGEASTSITHFVLINISPDKSANHFMVFSYHYDSKTKAKDETAAFNSMIASLSFK